MIICLPFSLSPAMMGEEGDWMLQNYMDLGRYDEFTYFTVYRLNMRRQNDLIFELAKATRGWGRIHAIDKLQPATQEIKDWLLYEGLHNTVMEEYTALDCMTKSDAIQMLKKPLNQKDFLAITDILAALLPDAPMAGISAFDNRDEIMADYKARAWECGINASEKVQMILEYSEQ